MIVEKHNGVWGGCWCVSFHHKKGDPDKTIAQRKALKEKLVMKGKTHSALVYDGDQIVGWCQFGPPAELPARMSAYGKLGLEQPDWRIPCFFVDRDHRHQGVAKAALEGALGFIAAKGGGMVDAYPLSLEGKPYGSSFLWGGTETMFARAGFHPVVKLGKSKLVMRKMVRGSKPGKTRVA
jgi:GNAT superfamily N-acetyltransferase